MSETLNGSQPTANSGPSLRDPSLSFRPRLTRRQVLFGSLGLLVFVALLFLGGTDALYALASASPVYVMLALLVTLGMTILTARRWGDLTNLFLGYAPCTFWEYYRSFILGRAAGLIIPQAASDFGVRPLLHRIATDSSGISAFNGTVVERLLDGTLLLMTGIPSLLYLTRAITSSKFAVTLIFAVALWLFGLVGFSATLIRVLSRLLGRAADRFSGQGLRSSKVANWAATVSESLSIAAQESSVLRRVGAISVMRYGLISILFTLIARALGLEGIGLVEVLAALPIAQFGLIIAITPGGLGFLEGGFWSAFQLMNIAPEAINTFLLGQRVLVGVFVLILATLSFVPLLLQKRCTDQQNRVS